VATIARGLTVVGVFAATVGLLAQATPQQYLSDAKQALDSVATNGLKPSDAKPMADLNKDFADLQAAYVAAIGVPAAAGATQPVSTGQQGVSDWQGKYSAVETDLIIVGDVGGPVKGQLDQFRASLEKFYNTALDQAIKASAPPPEAPLVQTSTCPPVAASASHEAVSLLDRVQTIVDDTLNGRVPKDKAVASSGSKELRDAGKVSIDRAALDEILAEVGHLKLLLQDSSAK
jgi:hypothetical protein